MKSIFMNTIAYSMFLLMFVSCKKDETQIVAGNGTAPTLTVNTQSIILDENKADETALNFTWTASSFGFKAGISYAVELDLSGNNFKSPKEVAAGAQLKRDFTVADLNSLVNQLGMTPGVSAELEVRVKASISDKYTPAYSNVIKLQVTPYLVEISYPSLYVPGSFQGWDPATAPKVSSVEDNGVYEGYIYLKDAENTFKFASAPNWDNVNYGESSPGKLNEGGGENITIKGAGYYLLKVDTKKLTYTALKTTWGIIGDATGSWDADTPLIYDAASGNWTVTKNLSAGAFKFRGNADWDMNFGDNKPADGKLKSNGENIPIAAAGSYRVTLKLSTPGNYSYSIEKL